MELVNGSFRHASPGGPTGPGGTLAAGCAADAWEDLWMVGPLLGGLLILVLGLGLSLIYQKICKTAGSRFTHELMEVNEKLKALQQRADQNWELTRNTSDRSEEVLREMDAIGAQLVVLLRVTAGLAAKVEELARSLRDLDARMRLRMRQTDGH